ncbi:hypothetical protein MMC19_001141 [Ptychographa xylographoides]|nr:hypothetical protein [Ptychographa xylographoides]
MVTVTLGEKKYSASITDAFLGSGRTIRRSKQQKDAERAHPPQPVPASPVAAPLPDPVVIPDAKPEEAASAPAPSIHTDSAWTAEQDKVFLDMKDQKHATWKEIGSALKRGKGELKLRYKLLKNASEGQNAPEADEEPKEDSPHKKDKISKKDGKKKAEEPGLNYDFGDSEQWGRQEGEEIDLTCNWAADLWDARPNEDLLEPMQDENEGPDTGPSIRPIIKVEAGTELSLDEIVYLYRSYEFYEKLKWTQIASKFFDKTGKRISEEELKDKLGSIKLSDPF